MQKKPKNPTEAGTLEIETSVAPKMARTYYTYNGFKIYEVGFPVGEDAAFFAIIEGERHYFKTVTQAKLYLDRNHSPS